jgi:hypothetical protein
MKEETSTQREKERKKEIPCPQFQPKYLHVLPSTLARFLRHLNGIGVAELNTTKRDFPFLNISWMLHDVTHLDSEPQNSDYGRLLAKFSILSDFI